MNISDSSWAWQNILKHIKEANNFIVYSIADVRDMFVWHDSWCGSTSLLDNLEAREVLRWMLIKYGCRKKLVHQMSDCLLREYLESAKQQLHGERQDNPSGDFSQRCEYLALEGGIPVLRKLQLLWGIMVVT